jgi:hypothetical protein
MKAILTIFLITTVLISYSQSIDIRIVEIRHDYNLINSNIHFKKDSIIVTDESTEGGQILFYKDSIGQLKKMVVTFLSEEGKIIEEFYLKNDRLFFKLTHRYDYNRPIYWTQKVAKGNGDNEVLDYNKSKITENRYYFDSNETLIRWIDNDKKIIEDKITLKKIQIDLIRELTDFRSKIK